MHSEMSKSPGDTRHKRNRLYRKSSNNYGNSNGYLKLGSINIQGSVDTKLKFNDVGGLINCDICFIQETWFTKSSVMSEANNNIFRSDRNKNRKAAGSGGFKPQVRPGLQTIRSKVSRLDVGKAQQGLLWSR